MGERRERRSGKGISVLKKGLLGAASDRVQSQTWEQPGPCEGGLYSRIRISGSMTGSGFLTFVFLLAFSKLPFEYVGLSQLRRQLWKEKTELGDRRPGLEL